MMDNSTIFDRCQTHANSLTSCPTFADPHSSCLPYAADASIPKSLTRNLAERLYFRENLAKVSHRRKAGRLVLQ